MTHSSQGPDQPEDPTSPATPEPDSTTELPSYWDQHFGGQSGQSDQAPAAPHQADQAPAAPYQSGAAPGPYQPGAAPGPYQPGYPPPAAPYQPGDQPPAGAYQPGYPAGYQAPYPPQNPGSDVYLSNPYLLAPPPAKRGPARKLIAGGAVLAVLAAGAVAAYAYTTLASSGSQPEKVLPATTVAFAKLDLDPAANQKIAAYRLSKKFPKVVKGAGNLDEERNALLSSFFDDQSDLDYRTDVKPWLGDRFAVAAVPDTAAAAGLDPVLAVAYTDEAKMKAAMSKLARTERDFGYVTLDSYVLISDSQPHADAVLAAARQGTLAKSDQFRSDLKSLHGDQIALGWADVSAAVAAVKAGTGASASSRVEDLRKLDSLAGRGRIVVGAHANADYLEVAAVTRGAGWWQACGQHPGERHAGQALRRRHRRGAGGDRLGRIAEPGLERRLRRTGAQQRVLRLRRPDRPATARRPGGAVRHRHHPLGPVAGRRARSGVRRPDQHRQGRARPAPARHAG